MALASGTVAWPLRGTRPPADASTLLFLFVFRVGCISCNCIGDFLGLRNFAGETNGIVIWIRKVSDESLKVWVGSEFGPRHGAEMIDCARRKMKPGRDGVEEFAIGLIGNLPEVQFYDVGPDFTSIAGMFARESRHDFAKQLGGLEGVMADRNLAERI